jgi:hypothetical protein
MRAHLIVLCVALVALGACDSSDDESVEGERPTSTPSASTSSTEFVRPDAAPVPINDDPCSGEPPFQVVLPEGFGEITPGPPGGPSVVPELYDPTFHSMGPDGTAVTLFHGNSWRLTATLDREVEVLGEVGWLSTTGTGAPLIDFAVPPAADGCDYWAISGVGLDAEALLAIAATLTPE